MSARKMKDSGIEWIGEMPEEWEVCKLKNVVNFNPSYSENLLEGKEVSFVPMEYLGNGKFEFQAKPIEAVVKGYNYFANGDIIMAKVTPCFENGNIAIVKNLLNGVGFGSSEIYTLRCFGCSTKFLFYFLQNSIFKNRCVSSMYGVAGLKRIPIKFLQDYKLLMPPFAEQKAIADYLDEKCAAIDRIVASKQKQNEQLAEYRQSLITEAVTKGLNPSAPTKDSGIDWIAQIPKTWEIIQLKYLFSMYAGGDVDANDFSTDRTDKFKYPIYSNSLDNEGLFGYMSYYRFCGETITVTGRGDVGKAIARNNAFYPIVRLLVCVPKLVVDVRYFTYCINSADLFGDQTAMAQLTTQKLSAVKVPVPKYTEQKEIADYLDKKCGEIDALSEHNKNIIESLQEYKQSLIYEAVTGKIEL
ncbi:MAG: restriction endonuclease subunit S [Acidaminococcaceae bacterium]